MVYCKHSSGLVDSIVGNPQLTPPSDTLHSSPVGQLKQLHPFQRCLVRCCYSNITLVKFYEWWIEPQNNIKQCFFVYCTSKVIKVV